MLWEEMVFAQNFNLSRENAQVGVAASEFKSAWQELRSTVNVSTIQCHPRLATKTPFLSRDVGVWKCCINERCCRGLGRLLI